MARKSRRDTLEKIAEHFEILAAAWHARFHQTRIPTHAATSSLLIGTPNCVPWRKPFVMQVRGSLYCDSTGTTGSLAW